MTQLKTHVMADIETLGTDHNSLIMEFGAVKFNAEEILDRFHVGVIVEDADRLGQKIDGSTVWYWLDPARDEARKRMFEIPRVPLYPAFDGLTLWIEQTPESERGDLWGKGSTFDNMLLRDTAKLLNVEFPWDFRGDSCYRTLAKLCPQVEYEQIGIKHSGVDDAESQAVHLQRICKHLGLKL